MTRTCGQCGKVDPPPDEVIYDRERAWHRSCADVDKDGYVVLPSSGRLQTLPMSDYDEDKLAEIDKLMGQRDRWEFYSRDERLGILQALADEVPGLVKEVRRLKG